MVTLDIPSEYGYVLLSATSTFIVSIYLGMRVGSFRGAAKIPYPYEYASYEQVQTASPSTQKALLAFNCAQRGHQNFNENHPSALGALLIAGLGYPKAAAIAGAVWAVNRVVYAIGYTNGKEGGRGRYNGIAWMLAHWGMIGMAGKVGYDVLMS